MSLLQGQPTTRALRRARSANWPGGSRQEVYMGAGTENPARGQADCPIPTRALVNHTAGLDAIIPRGGMHQKQCCRTRAFGNLCRRSGHRKPSLGGRVGARALYCWSTAVEALLSEQARKSCGRRQRKDQPLLAIVNVGSPTTSTRAALFFAHP